MSKHTPGPWTQGIKDNTCVWLDGNVEIDGMTMMSNFSLWIDCNTEANARLVAAAPDLLEALKAMIAAHVVPSTACKERPAYEQAVAAIAKAEG